MPKRVVNVDMPAHDLFSSIPPAGNRTTGTTTGTGLDLQLAARAIVTFTPATITDGTHAPTVEEGDTLGGSYTTVAAGDLSGTLANLATNTTQKVAYRGSKRFIRAVVVSSGTTTGGIFAAQIVREKSQV